MLITLLVLGVLLVVAPGAGARGTGSTPPNGIYTCSWIAAHPAEALAARVTCDASMFLVATAPSALAVLTDGLQAPLGATPDAYGCTYVPTSGNIGQGVFAWSGYEYANQWQFTPTYSPNTYTYYIQRTGGVTYTWGDIYDPYTHTVGVPANIYRWGVQNRSSQVNNWYVCYSG